MEERELIKVLKKIRLKKKMSTRQVYTKLGWRQQKLSLIENNKTTPSLNTINALASVYGYTLKLVKNGE